MAIAVDGSTPAGVSQTVNTTATVATGSFTPPSGSVLIAAWQSNTQTGNTPGTPTIASSPSLTWTLINWRSMGDAGSGNGQCAMWWALPTGAAMTATVTNGAVSGFREARLKCVVFTGVDTTSPIASSGEGNDSGGALDTLTYNTTVANSQGIGTASDWDVASTTFTAAAGTTISDSATPNGNINGATLLQTTQTATVGATITLGLTSPTSTQWNYVWAELRPSGGATSALRPKLVIPVGAVIRASSW